MNFHLPLNSNVEKYSKYLDGFGWRDVPDAHKDAWRALSYLRSNYHRTSEITAEHAIQFYRGLQIFLLHREEK